MPYQVIHKDKGFKVCKKDEPNKCFSKKGLSKKRAEKQMKAIIISELKGGGFLKSGMNKKDYLEIIKYIAKKYGYDPELINFTNDKKHKLIYDNVKFGGYNNFDFIQYLYKFLNNEISEEELLNHRKKYLARATRIKGAWKDNILSPNNLAIRLLWLG